MAHHLGRKRLLTSLRSIQRARFLPSISFESGGRKWRGIVATNVLVVDDEENVREFLVDVLRANGYCATGVGSGKDALQMLGVLDYDMVVTDLHMPQMNGFELMSEISCEHPGTRTILMTAEAWPEMAREARRRGAFDVIYKPFRYNQLLSVMKRSLRECQRSGKERRRDTVASE
jgi:DNA-binding NtrC family response regulator